MKCIVLVLLAVAAVYGAPQVPVFSYSYSTVNYQSAPLVQQPVAFRPQSEKQQFPPQAALVPQDDRAKVPQVETTTEQDDVNGTTTEQPISAENTTRSAASEDKDKEKLVEGSDDSFMQQGVYYIYHPSGLLQRIVYSTKNDVENMGYTAQLKYQDVEPIREPIYTYDPNTYVLQPLQVQ